MPIHLPAFVPAALVILLANTDAQVIKGFSGGPVLDGKVERPLRYQPDGTDFVIESGDKTFNRSLYGPDSGFRVEAGDRPEFALFLPGRGGNLRVGFKTADHAKWAFDAGTVTARYRPGSMRYELRDESLGDATLQLDVIPRKDADAAILKAELTGGAGGVELVVAYGTGDGSRGRRGGDLGTEGVPLDEFFRFRPGNAEGSTVEIDGGSFVVGKNKVGSVQGATSPPFEFHTASADDWSSPDRLAAQAGSDSKRPVVVGTAPLTPGEPVFLELGKPRDTSGTDPREDFAKAEAARQRIAGTIVIETPDPFINAAAAALGPAAEAVWHDEQSAWLHGAVAWRVPLLGWRGDYIGDTLGWHDRQQRFFRRWAARQNTSSIPERIPAADPSDHLARNENALHSNGDMSGTHYDMNLVFIDALFRHLLWTGDVEFAREMWPVIKRHLAWEKRLFRREFDTADGRKLPLYEAYCCIWASDDLWYSGGGAAHASAYNYFHRSMAAKFARLIGEDPGPHEREAGLIAEGMRQLLWLPEKGWFAEGKDLLGLQRTRDNPALWTFYHTLDSGLPTADEASRMMRYVDTQLAHFPLKGPGVPDDRNYFTLPTSNWMPYAWSTNNVVMAEAAHTALAYWQADRDSTAFDLFKGCLLDSMFMGACPGNLGMCTSFDMARGESQRDFADGVGTVSRTMIEGLFGVKPDALAGELTIRPGFPRDWDHASLRHPDLELEFSSKQDTQTFTIRPKFAKPMALRLELAPWREEVEGVTINDRPATWTNEPGSSRITITAPAADVYEVLVTWKGDKPRDPVLPPAPEVVSPTPAPATNWNAPVGPDIDCIDLAPTFNDKITSIFATDYLSPRSPFCSLAIPKQGYGSWCHPADTFEIDDSGLRKVAARNQGRLSLPNGIPLQTPSAAGVDNVAFVSRWDNHPDDLTLPLSGSASHAYLLMAGSTNSMQSRIDNGEVIFTYTDGSTSRLALHNPTTWWPIDQDYVIDDFAFRYDGAIPPRIDLKTGKVRMPAREDLRNGSNQMIPGGAATVLDLPLDPTKPLESLTVRALSNEVVIGLMSVTLAR